MVRSSRNGVNPVSGLPRGTGRGRHDFVEGWVKESMYSGMMGAT